MYIQKSQSSLAVINCVVLHCICYTILCQHTICGTQVQLIVVPPDNGLLCKYNYITSSLNAFLLPLKYIDCKAIVYVHDVIILVLWYFSPSTPFSNWDYNNFVFKRFLSVEKLSNSNSV